MTRYRSKPTEVEAIRWTGQTLSRTMLGDSPAPVRWRRHPATNEDDLMLLAGKDGAQGEVFVPVGHWVVWSPDDLTDFWPVDPAYFAEKYAEAQEGVREPFPVPEVPSLFFFGTDGYAYHLSDGTTDAPEHDGGPEQRATCAAMLEDAARRLQKRRRRLDGVDVLVTEEPTKFWLNAMACVRPTGSFAEGVGRKVIRMVMQSDERDDLGVARVVHLRVVAS